MRLVYDDAVRAAELGMLGKWVGHPAQLFAVLLADDMGRTDQRLEDEAANLEAYGAAVAADQGATMIAGVMSDRATDRHARVVLRRATAVGRFDPARARALGVIDEAETGEASLAYAARDGGPGDA
jgi:citrate lyase beta subunit